MSGGDVIIALDFPSAEAVYAFLDKFENEARKPYVKAVSYTHLCRQP